MALLQFQIWICLPKVIDFDYFNGISIEFCDNAGRGHNCQEMQWDALIDGIRLRDNTEFYKSHWHFWKINSENPNNTQNTHDAWILAWKQ